MIILQQDFDFKFLSSYNFITRHISSVSQNEFKEPLDIQQALMGTVVNLCGEID